MEKVVVKPTWQLAWGLCWRMCLIHLGVCGIIFGILAATGVLATLYALLQRLPTMPY